MQTQTFDAGIAYAAYNGRLLAFIIAAFTAFAMSAYFICGYFVGTNQFWLWTFDQWVNAVPGLGITFAMTAFQAILYTNHNAASKWVTVLSICVAAGFSVLSEVGQGMDRDNIRMESKSLESPAYKALVGSLAGAANSGYVPYSLDLQQAQARLATCQKKMAQGVYQDCAESQARLDAVRQMIEMSQAATANKSLALAQTAKSMERDENNFHPLVNLIRTQVGVAGIVASFILSLTIIVFFEYAFHYLGARYAESRDYLLGHGYDTTRRARRAPRALHGANDEAIPYPAPAPKPAARLVKKPAKKPLSVQGTHEEQLSIELPTNGDAAQVTRTTGVRVDTDKISPAMQARYDANESVGASNSVDCPWCNSSFVKRTYNHRFCKTACKDDWHNAANPERLQHKGRG